MIKQKECPWDQKVVGLRASGLKDCAGDQKDCSWDNYGNQARSLHIKSTQITYHCASVQLDMDPHKTTPGYVGYLDTTAMSPAS